MKFLLCDRCNKEMKTNMMSWFNKDIICFDCVDEEKKHPLFKTAKDSENEEVKKGNYNYPGMFADKNWSEIVQIKEFIDIFKPNE